MRIDELTGVRRYQRRTLYDWLSDFQAVGGWYEEGTFGIVVGHSKWHHVYKFFADDECYLDYVNWVIESPNVCAPNFLSRPKQIVPFYRRYKSEKMVWIVKMERLLPVVTPPVPNIEHHIMGAERLYRIIGDAEKETEYLASHDIPSYMNRINEYRNAWTLHPQLRDLCAFYWDHVVYAQIPCQLDLHWKNIMKRHDGTYVLTDPFWYGDSRNANLGDTEIDDSMIDGRA